MSQSSESNSSYKSDANDYGMEKWIDSDSSADSNPPRTRLGRKPIPDTETSAELVYQLRMNRNDVPFLAAIVRRSTVVFEGDQLKLRDDLLEHVRLERLSGNIFPYYEALGDFIDSLEDRIRDEFYDDRKDMYTNVYEVLDHSSFPYSMNQSSCLDRFREAMYSATGYPFDQADEAIEARVKDLVGLLESKDHLSDNTPFRVVIRSMIPFYLREIVKKLEALSRKEKVREIPRFVPLTETLNLATYLVGKLEPLIEQEGLFKGSEHFDKGMLEIYTRLVEIFRTPALSFTNSQEVAFQKVEREIRAFKRDFDGTRHAGINEACYDFMNEFEGDHPDQEWMFDETGKYVLVPNSSRNQTIREIANGLYCLRHATADHLETLSTFSFGIVDVVDNITGRFLDLYPIR